MTCIKVSTILLLAHHIWVDWAWWRRWPRRWPPHNRKPAWEKNCTHSIWKQALSGAKSSAPTEFLINKSRLDVNHKIAYDSFHWWIAWERKHPTGWQERTQKFPVWACKNSTPVSGLAPQSHACLVFRFLASDCLPYLDNHCTRPAHGEVMGSSVFGISCVVV